MDDKILFIPGPVEVDAELREIMAMPLIGHRSPAFVEKVQAVCDKLKGLFLTDAHALFENCPATALMDAGVRNLVRKRILHLTSGAFGERWAIVSASCGRQVESISVDWGQPNLPELLHDKLKETHFDAVAVTHNETSTGVCNPLPEIARSVRDASPETLILVDTVSGLGGAELRFDEWGLDLAFAGTQKCLALPPGLCVFAISERAIERASGMPDRGFMLDFERLSKGLAAGRTVATPCVPLVFALSRQLDRIAKEGLSNRWQRHLDMRSAVTAWAAQKGFSFLPEEPYRSPTVSCLRNSGHAVPDLIDRAAQAGFILGNGYGQLKGETFRIGHMGDHSIGRLEQLLSALA